MLKREEELRDIYVRHSKTLPTDNTNSTLYHYTNWGGLIGILSSRTLHFTSCWDLNDKREIEYSFDIIADVIKNVIGAEHAEVWSKILDRFKEILRDKYQWYLASFCEVKDNLPTWQTYANNCRGFAIGFRKEFFQPHASTNSDENDFTYVYTKIDYDKGNASKQYEPIIRDFYNHFLAFGETYDGNNISLAYNSFASHLAALLMPYLMKYKSDYFIHERECRISANQGLHRKINVHTKEVDSNKCMFSEVDCKIENGELNQKHYIDSEKLEHGDINEIWIGPRCNSCDLVRDKVTEVLIANGYEVDGVKIHNSNLPIR